ncbi:MULTISPECIES: hypothetical protein [unclassified Lentimonas]|uniref:hypothetical protein n=1 Tax=unclassified Lentimonas TaxID=2630993 RepID=UPI00132773DE|nr:MULTISPECIES: hypothetical protein [unclassified Lentimonas]CAA6679037.1 Unannotated [Lentimonas sp. CC4]CAA6684223.1 Unannotated [Lentimonas sp. CC6]CAA7076404.1 Unannotated [Lentimonas sp. CC4]CAA7171829.1 Unannotated [Lentimonas sp. CC21]CAA7183159.1 Unannotated [Lentimonas sp. CC8]
MKKEFESFLVWYIPVSILSTVIASMCLPIWTKGIAQDVATGGDVEFGILYTLIVTFSGSVHKLVAAVWLWHQQKKANGRFVLWALFGFFSGIWAVAFHIGFSIYKDTQPRTIPPVERSA